MSASEHLQRELCVAKAIAASEEEIYRLKNALLHCQAEVIKESVREYLTRVFSMKQRPAIVNMRFQMRNN